MRTLGWEVGLRVGAAGCDVGFPIGGVLGLLGDIEGCDEGNLFHHNNWKS